MKSKNIITFIGLLFIILTPYITYAEKLNVEWIASEIAKKHNESIKSNLDDMTISSTATAVGKNVIIKNIQRFRRNISKEKLSEYQSMLYKELVPNVCQANKNNPAFKQGLYYTFIYVSHYDQKLAKFTFNEKTCAPR
jgi:hypothetical protein